MNIKIKADEIPPATESETYGINLQVLEDNEVYDSVDNYDPHSFYVWRKTTSTLWSFLSETLDPVNRDIVLRYVVEEQTFAAISKLYGLSLEATRQRYVKSMRKLRRRIRHLDQYDYIRSTVDNDILAELDYLPTILDAENPDHYKQYMIRNPKPSLVKPAKPAKPKVKKHKKKVVVTEPVESVPTDTDESSDVSSPKLSDFIEEYIPKSVYATVSTDTTKANECVQFYRSWSGISRIMLCSSSDPKVLFIDDVRIDLRSNLVCIGAHYLVSEEWIVEVGLHDFLDVLGIDAYILSHPTNDIRAAIQEGLQYPNMGWVYNLL